MSKWSFRLATPEDAPAFSKWAAENSQIDQRDLIAGMGKTNPTVLVFVIEKEGVPILFGPIYLAAVLAHLGFNPAARASEKMQALDVMKDGLMAFFIQYGIRELMTKSRPGYGVAQWAVAHGFEFDDRSLLTLDLNKEIAPEV